jgi:Plavaka transposase
MFVPIILGSDKTTVSVATGQNDFYPLYLSIGNVKNHIRRAHKDALVLIGFLAIPKSTYIFYFIINTTSKGHVADREHDNSPAFRTFRRQLFHSSLALILDLLRPGMTSPEITRCPDGHFRRVVYGLGPYIADYPEQALLACVVSNWCPRCVKFSATLPILTWQHLGVLRHSMTLMVMDFGVLRYGLTT